MEAKLKSFLLITVGALILAGCEDAQEVENGQNIQKETIEITANELHKTFENNKLDAYNKYGNKRLIISGFFSSVDKHWDGGYSFDMAILSGGYDGSPQVSPYEEVKIYTPDSEGSQLASLKSGDLVTVTCDTFPEPEDTFSWAVLKDCSGVQVVASGSDGVLRYLEMLNGGTGKTQGAAPQDSDQEVYSGGEDVPANDEVGAAVDGAEKTADEAMAAADEAMAAADEF